MRCAMPLKHLLQKIHLKLRPTIASVTYSRPANAANRFDYSLHLIPQPMAITNGSSF